MLVETFQEVFIPLWMFTPKRLQQELSRYQNNTTGDILDNVHVLLKYSIEFTVYNETLHIKH